MTNRNLIFFFTSVTILGLYSCAICFGGGELKVKKKYVYNKCGLLNGVSVSEIKVDSFQNNIPTKYITIRATYLFRQGASPNNDPKRLYFDKDYKQVYLYSNNKIIDTIEGPMIFKKEVWYLLEDDDTDVFMFIEKSGHRQLFSKQKLKVNL